MTEQELAELLRRNPDLQIASDFSAHLTKKNTETNALAQKFMTLWQACGGPPLTPEFRFDPARRWRFDFAHEPTRIAVELNGGAWTNGRHTRGQGYLRDREKVNEAILAGWRVFELGTGQISAQTVQRIVEFVKEQEKTVAACRCSSTRQGEII